MKNTDWQIIKALRTEARKSLTAVADELRVSTRTVKRRFTTMRDQNAFFLMPLTAYEKSAVVSCSFTVHCPDGKKKKTVDHEIKSKVERIIFSNTSAKEYSVFTVLCNNLTAQKKFRDGLGESAVSEALPWE